MVYFTIKLYFMNKITHHKDHHGDPNGWSVLENGGSGWLKFSLPLECIKTHSNSLLKPVPWEERSLVRELIENSLYYHIVFSSHTRSEWISQVTNLNGWDSIIVLQQTNPSSHYFTQKQRENVHYAKDTPLFLIQSMYDKTTSKIFKYSWAYKNNWSSKFPWFSFI